MSLSPHARAPHGSSGNRGLGVSRWGGEGFSSTDNDMPSQDSQQFMALALAQEANQLIASFLSAMLRDYSCESEDGIDMEGSNPSAFLDCVP